MSNYDKVDTKFTWDGDYEVGLDGDLADTSDDQISSLETEIRTIVSASLGDWEKSPSLGANLSDFRGEPNTRETGNKIRERIISAIVAQGIVKQSDITVRVIPVHVYQVMIMISVKAASTPYNRLTPGEPLIVTFTYDTMEDNVFFISTGNIENYGF